jgi:lipopolysaccharide transport system ATP-binding protein
MPAIKVENLSKSYLVGHNAAQGERYTALRDVIARNARDLARKTRDMIHGRAIIQGDEVEEFWALKDINFEIQQGDRVGIIGRNGAGKSTLLKILSRITEPTTGRITINGRVASLLEVGTGFHPELTGRENIFLNGAILGMSRKEIQKKFDEIVEFSEVERFLDTPVKRYSSGMYVRLAFSVAAHLESEILIVDEVLAVGDFAFQKKCLGKMEEVTDIGRSVLFVSHNLSAITHLCNTGLVLDMGKMGYFGGIDRARDYYIGAISQGDNSYAGLREHPRRQKDMLGLMTGIGLLGGSVHGEYRYTIQAGEDAIFEIQLDCSRYHVDYAVLAVSSIAGERVCTVSTNLDPRFSQAIDGKGLLYCRMPSLSLPDGEYSVLVALGNKQERRHLDEIVDAIRFRVETNNYFGTGENILSGQGYLLVRPEWWTRFDFPHEVEASTKHMESN